MAQLLVVVGGGRMGTALVRGLLAAGHDPAGLGVVEAAAERRAALPAEVGADVAVLAAVPDRPAGAVLAVKPADASAACAALAAAGTSRVLSICAGVTLARLQGWLGEGCAVLRAMPNTPATVGAGVSAVAAGPGAEPSLDWALEVLGAVGTAVAVPEAALDAVTGLSGSGPAYVFLVVEALVEAGVRAGLPAALSRTLAVHTVAGAGRLLVDTGSDPEALRAQVTSPGGTTAAGLAVLEGRAVRAAFVEAVAAAAARSRELGQAADQGG